MEPPRKKWNRPRNKYGLGSGCHAESRVGESIGSKHKDRNKLVKIEGRWNECEHWVPFNVPEIEWVTAVPNRTLKWFGWFVSVRFLMNFCIWLEREWNSWSIFMAREDSICRGYGEFHLFMTYFRAFLHFSFSFRCGSNSAAGGVTRLFTCVTGGKSAL